MRNSEILSDPQYQRGRIWLNTKINSPADLYSFWRTYGSWRDPSIPAIEKCYPWWQNLD